MTYATSIDSLLSASPTGDYLSIFSNYDPTSASSSVYNTNLWGGGGHTLDFSGIVWWEDHDGVNENFSRAVAITKRHLLCSVHGGSQGNGWPLYFVKPDGTSVMRRAFDYVQFGPVGDGDGLVSFRVLYLTEDLPDGVMIYKVSADLSIPRFIPGPPVVKLNQFHEACIADVFVFDQTMALPEPTEATRDIYYKPAIGGDSGSPVFLVDGTQMIYFGSITSSGNGGGVGPDIAFYPVQLLDACRTLDARYDNTGYAPTFSPALVASSQPGCSIGIGIGL